MKMNMNRKQLEPKERELISKVLDFPFPRPATTQNSRF